MIIPLLQVTAEFFRLTEDFFGEQGNLSAEQRNWTRPLVCSAQHLISDLLGHAVTHGGDKPDQKGTWPNHQRQRSAFPNPRRPPSRDSGSRAGPVRRIRHGATTAS
jgi:hypothetical protein